MPWTIICFLLVKEKLLERCNHVLKKVLKNETRGINPINKKDGESIEKKLIVIKREGLIVKEKISRG
jgi:hypothetical protein